MDVFRILLNLLNSRCRSCSLSACALGTYSASWTHFSSAMVGECGLMGCGEMEYGVFNSESSKAASSREHSGLFPVEDQVATTNQFSAFCILHPTTLIAIIS